MTLLSALASVGMAVGPPLVYVDQMVSIVRKQDSTGFSMDVCGVLLVANIVRIFFWFGKRFEIALLVQSVLMILFQLALLYVCLKFRRPILPTVVTPNKGLPGSATALLSNTPTSEALSRQAKVWYRPLNLWAWESYGTYIEFLAALIVANTILYIVLGWMQTYIDTIGLVALGLESTLPLPQLLSNYQRKSLAGFRLTVLAGWIGGDAFKTVYFFLQEGNSWQFKATACFQLSIDCLIAVQYWLYRHNTNRQQLLPVADEHLGEVEPRESIEVR